MFELTGKVAVITGAGSGIGRGIALSLAGAGADVVTSDLFLERAEETAAMVRDTGRQALAQRADVRELESVGALAEAAVRAFGRLDICIANAGIVRTGSVLTMTEEDWSEIVAVNQSGVFYTVQACAREMVRAQRGGRVITIASIMAAHPTRGSFGYSTTKAAVVMMSRCWAQDLAPFGVTVNSIGPGYVESRMGVGAIGPGDAWETYGKSIPAGRTGTPEDIGHLAVWLASDEAAYVTGAYHVSDGGWLDRSWSRDDTVTSDLERRREQFASLDGDELLAALDAEAAEGREGWTALRRMMDLP
jgi:NAD(P)-dependent dehydrogenase (short-subunit alcohol dehydrogenase family)